MNKFSQSILEKDAWRSVRRILYLDIRDWRKISPIHHQVALCKLLTRKYHQEIVAELWQPKTAMQSPVPREHMHSFSYGHLRQQQMACTRARATERPVPILVNLCIAYIFAIWYWRSILWSIDSCQIKVSADQYHMTISQPQVGTHRGQVVFWSWPLTRLWIFIGFQAQVFSQIIRTSQKNLSSIFRLSKIYILLICNIQRTFQKLQGWRI